MTASAATVATDISIATNNSQDAGVHDSAALADGNNIFIATEYISGVDRDTFVNWATSMSEIKTPK